MVSGFQTNRGKFRLCCKHCANDSAQIVCRRESVTFVTPSQPSNLCRPDTWGVTAPLSGTCPELGQGLRTSRPASAVGARYQRRGVRFAERSGGSSKEVRSLIFSPVNFSTSEGDFS